MNELLASTFGDDGSVFATAAGAAICGAAIGALSMLVYAKLSPQTRIAQLRIQIADARSALRGYDDSDMHVVWDLTRHALGLSLQQIRLILVPTACVVGVVLGCAWLVDTVLDYSHLYFSTAVGPAWLFSGYVAFWFPLTVAAIALKWKLAIQ